MSSFPNLTGKVDPSHMSTKGSGSYTADYVNWARTMQYLRDEAPDWLPEIVLNAEGGDVHVLPDGSGYLKIRFVNTVDALTTPAVVHAIMDNRNNAKKQIDARDVSDAYVRGICKAAALMFGLAWQMWSKDDPLSRPESPVQANEPVTQVSGPSTVQANVEAPDDNGVVVKVKSAIATAANGRQLTDYARRIAEMLNNQEITWEQGKEIARALGEKVVALDVPDASCERIKKILVS